MRRRTFMLAGPMLAAPVMPGTPPRLPVVATFTILADLARMVGGDAIALTCLVGPDRDVHEYQPQPDDLRAIRRTRLLLRNGAGLEGWLDRLVQAAGYAGPAASAAVGVALRRLGGAPDPHIWQDPLAAIRMTANIAAALAEADPPRARFYAARQGQAAAAISAAHRALAAGYAAIPASRRVIVTSHDAFFYYGARYGIEMLAIQGMTAEGEPSAADLAALIETLRARRIATVFLESMADPKFAATLAREAGARVGPAVYSDALSPAGGPAATYLDLLRWDARQFFSSMR